MDTRLHCVYFLVSLDPSCEHQFYIGYTTNPLRRLRQHNGELTNGAWRTSRRGRPWTMVFFLSGFPEDRVGLKFEWCWQHPFKAVVLREAVTAAPDAAALQRHLHGLRKAYHAVAVLHLLLRCELFRSMSLRLNVLDDARWGHYCASIGHRHRSLGPLVPSALLRIASMSHDDVRELLPNHPEDDGAASSIAAAADRTTTSNAMYSESFVEDDESSMAAWSDGRGPPSSVVYSATDPSTSSLYHQHHHSRDDAANTSSVGGGSFSQRNGGADNLSQPQQTLRGAAPLPPLCTFCAMPFDDGNDPNDMRCQRDQGNLQSCSLRAHIACTAIWFHATTTAAAGTATSAASIVETQQQCTPTPTPGGVVSGGGGGGGWRLIPNEACRCPLCNFEWHWSIGVQQLKQRSNATRASKLAQRRAILDRQLQQQLSAIQGGSTSGGPEQGRGGVGGGRGRGRGRGRGATKPVTATDNGPTAVPMASGLPQPPQSVGKRPREGDIVAVDAGATEEDDGVVERAAPLDADWWLD